MNKLILIVLFNTLVLPSLFGMESNENDKEQSYDHIAKLAQQVSQNVNLGHGLIYLGSQAEDSEVQKLRIGYAYEKFEGANYLRKQVIERISAPESKKE